MFYILLGVILLVSLSALSNQDLIRRLSFSPYAIIQQGQWYRFLSHVLVHGSFAHLFINLFVFYSFGRFVLGAFQAIKGPTFGSILFYFMLIGAAIFSSLKAFSKHKEDSSYHAIGASGVVSAVLFSFVLMQPLNSIYLFFIPIPIPAFIFGSVYLAYEYWMDKKSSDHVAHDAHFFGALFGILFTVFLDFSILSSFFSQIGQFINSFLS
ncbi:MAG: rhomboid family intramembrane serine protease [Luteibaculum sp.]